MGFKELIKDRSKDIIIQKFILREQARPASANDT